MSLWCDDFYVTPQGYYVIKIITRLLHQGISRLLRHDQSQTVSKSADLTRALMGSGELHVLMGGGPKAPPSVSSKVRVVE